MRQIDGDARRQLLADAVWRLLRRGGLEAASVRAVAAEAGLATGSVRHFFGSQDDLHVFAMEELIRQTGARVEQALAGVEPAAGESGAEAARRRVRAGLLELLPVTPETSQVFLAHLQFVARAAVHPVLEPVATRSQVELELFYARCLEYLVQHGAAAPDLDVAAAVRRLAVLCDGLVLRRLTAPTLLDVDQLCALLDEHLDALDPGSVGR